MRKHRIAPLALALLLIGFLLPLPAQAAEGDARLVPAIREAPAFGDVTGTWCEDYVQTVYESGLMEGKTAERFDPAAPLTGAQITVISARLHSLLRGGDGVLPAPGEGEAWYQPAVDYLTGACEDEGVRTLLQRFSWTTQDFANDACIRLYFVSMLSGVLSETLPVINDIRDVPDTIDADVLAFYRAGILNGSDTYGTFEESAPLTRGAAAAMLARIVDPDERLTFTLRSFDLCRDVLGLDPETVLLTVDGTPVTAELFAYQLCTSLYQWGGSADAALQDAIRFWCDYDAPFQVLAVEKGITLSAEELAECTAYGQSRDGHLGLSAAYWQHRQIASALNLSLRDLYVEADWKWGEGTYHNDLEAVSAALLEEAAPTDMLRSLDFTAVYQRLLDSPWIGWRF